MNFLLSLLFFFIFNNAFGAKLFDDISIINAELKYDIARLQTNKENLRKDGLNAQFTTQLNDKPYKVQVLSRGKGSFDCKQPQLKLKFNKKENKGTLFSGIKKIKLFTRGTCLENKYDPEQDKQIIANYLIYKLYEEVTDFSFKTRLLKIRYIDTSNTYPSYEQYAFFLEPKKSLQKRLNLEYVEIFDLLQLGNRISSKTNFELVSIVNGFEFFISNYDYGIPGYFSHIINDSGYQGINYSEKNSKMFKNTNGEMFPIIYDFDFSRFSYFGLTCMFGYKLFMQALGFNPKCSVEVIASNIKDDLEKFKYSADVYKNSKKLLNALKLWKEKNHNLITILGTEYKKGIAHFSTAFHKTINGTRQ